MELFAAGPARPAAADHPPVRRAGCGEGVRACSTSPRTVCCMILDFASTMNQTCARVQEQHLPGDHDRKVGARPGAGASTASSYAAPGTSPFEARLPELRRRAAAGVVMPTVCVDMLHFIGAFDPTKLRATPSRR